METGLSSHDGDCGGAAPTLKLSTLNFSQLCPSLIFSRDFPTFFKTFHSKVINYCDTSRTMTDKGQMNDKDCELLPGTIEASDPEQCVARGLLGS